MAQESISEKYFAYYIPVEKPILKQDIEEALIRMYGEELGKQVANQILRNINFNDYKYVMDKNIEKYKNYLVLVKIADVKELFTFTENDIHNFKFLNTSSIQCEKKICNRYELYIYEPYKIPIFSGTQNLDYIKRNKKDEVVLPNFNYIFMETILIPLNKFFCPDSVDNEVIKSLNHLEKFINSFALFTEEINQVLPDSIDSICLDVLKLLHSIFKSAENTYKVSWQILSGFLPLLDSNYNSIVMNLWKKIMKPYNNPLEFLRNHNLIINNKINIIREYDTNTNTNTNKKKNKFNLLSTLECLIDSRLFITKKHFKDIDIFDALPYRNYFITNENLLTPASQKHNYIVQDIHRKKTLIQTLKRQCENNKINNSQKNKIIEDINYFETELINLYNKLSPFSVDYNKHLLHKTDIGIHCSFYELTNNFTIICYFQSICMNASSLKNLFKFQYKVSSIQSNIGLNDIFNLYIHKDFLAQILYIPLTPIDAKEPAEDKQITRGGQEDFSNSLSTPIVNQHQSLHFQLDLFTTSRFFKLNTCNCFDNEKYNIENYKYNSKYRVEQSLFSIKRLDTYLKENIAIELLQHQKSNLLWMIEIEDKIDNEKLIANSIATNLYNISNVEDIENYVSNLKNELPEAYTNHYYINFNKNKYLLELNKNASLAKNWSILSFLNIENTFGVKPIHYYSVFNTDIVKKLLNFEDYRKLKAIQIPLSGGVLCDEVGLGKTLSVISTCIVKLKHDMKKYSAYKSSMAKLYSQLSENISDDFIDPLENGFEYNNLIIVPSRLTSQWEEEINKYCADKFNLRVKVLATINSIRSLEEELHDFNEKIATNKVANATEFRNYNKKKPIQKNIKSKKESKSNAVSQEPIIKQNEFNEINIVINEQNINDINAKVEIELKSDNENTNKELGKKITKEHKIIKKLMINAKKKLNQNKELENKELENINRIKKRNKKDTIIDNPLAPIISEKISLDKVFELQNKFKNTIIESNESNESNELLENREKGDENLEYEDKDKDENKDRNEDKDKDENKDRNKELYEYILPYIESGLESKLELDDIGEDYYREQLYDVYIVSINLLSNNNYLQYINHSEENHLCPFIDSSIKKENHKKYMAEKIIENFSGTPKISRIINKFNIFKIKWNRIILDEAHEKLNSVVKYFNTKKNSNASIRNNKSNLENQFLFENLISLKSNYKWALTGTPTQYGVDNIMGILQFIIKRSIYDVKQIKKIRYFSDLLGMSAEELDLCLSEVFKKTLKKEVKSDLNIPLFTEEIIYVEQTNIERNIYNSIRASRHFTDIVKLRRLFLMCTNILINEGYDFNSDNDIKNSIEPITLEQLNNNMIECFTKQLNKILKEETKHNGVIKLYKTRLQQWQSVIDYISTLKCEDKIEKTILDKIKEQFDNCKKPSVRNNIEKIYSLLEIFLAYQEPQKAGQILLLQSEIIEIELDRIWKKHWETENIMNWLASKGSEIGVKKSTDEIILYENKVKDMQNEKIRINNQIKLFSNNDFLKEKTGVPCIICFDNLEDVVITPCRHIFCLNCTKHLSKDLKKSFNCPECRTCVECNKINITTVDIIHSRNNTNQDIENNNTDNTKNTKNNVVENNIVENNVVENNEKELVLTNLEKKYGLDWKLKCINKYGSKMAKLVEYLDELFITNPENRIIIFSQYDKMLKMIGKTLDEFNINYVYCQGNNYIVNKNIQKFKKDNSIRVIMLSSETSNSGSNLTEANYIIFIDVLFNAPEHIKATEAQAIGRAVRLGQKLPVKVVRFITRGTIEEEFYKENKYDMNSLQE